MVFDYVGIRVVARVGLGAALRISGRIVFKKTGDRDDVAFLPQGTVSARTGAKE
jgi:hypothetical protein